MRDKTGGRRRRPAELLKKSRALLAIMILPAIISGAALLGLQQHNGSRSLFFSAGFAVLILVRGGVRPGRGAGSAACGAPPRTALVVLASATTVPKAGAQRSGTTWVDRSAGAGDAVATVDSPATRTRSLQEGLCPGRFIAGAGTARTGPPAHLGPYTFPIRLAVVQPAIWERLQQHYTVAARFPGTVGGGAIVVMKSQ